jgi:tetratricopeptide (TPR) repeat protein
MEMPDMDDADAAMAWLEALAAKQGAKEEELLTAPEDRRDDIPDWLKGILDEEALEEPASPIEKTAISTRTAELVEFESAAPSEPEFLEEEEPAFPEPESEPAPALPAADTLDEDAALAWLESLAMKHGVNEAELLTEVEKRPEGTPDWVNAVADKARAEEQAQVEAEELALQEIPDEIFTDEGEPLSEPPLAEIEPSETPDWLAELSEAETEAPPAEEEALPEWLTDSAANWIATLSEETPAETPEAPVQAEEEEMPVEEPVTDEPAAIETVEFPAWLMEEESAAESPDWVLEEPSEAPAATESIEVPSWILRKAPEESLAADLEIPAWLMEEAPEEALADDLEIPAWLAEENLPAEEEPEDLTPAQEPEPAFEAEPEIESEPASEASLLVAAGEALTQARTTLARGEVAAANAHYARLIKTNQNIDEAITDITEALNTRYPVDIDLWLSLGDAYVKKSKLQDALDAYTKAEELLR